MFQHLFPLCICLVLLSFLVLPFGFPPTPIPLLVCQFLLVPDCTLASCFCFFFFRRHRCSDSLLMLRVWLWHGRRWRRKRRRFKAGGRRHVHSGIHATGLRGPTVPNELEPVLAFLVGKIPDPSQNGKDEHVPPKVGRLGLG